MRIQPQNAASPVNDRMNESASRPHRRSSESGEPREKGFAARARDEWWLECNRRFTSELIDRTARDAFDEVVLRDAARIQASSAQHHARRAAIRRLSIRSML